MEPRPRSSIQSNIISGRGTSFSFRPRVVCCKHQGHDFRCGSQLPVVKVVDVARVILRIVLHSSTQTCSSLQLCRRTQSRPRQIRNQSSVVDQVAAFRSCSPPRQPEGHKARHQIDKIEKTTFRHAAEPPDQISMASFRRSCQQSQAPLQYASMLSWISGLFGRGRRSPVTRWSSSCGELSPFLDMPRIKQGI